MALKVYLVLDYEYRGKNIFSSREKAEHFIKQHNYVDCEIEEVEVDKCEVKDIPIGYNLYYIELLKNGDVKKIEQRYIQDTYKIDFHTDIFYPGNTYISRKKTAKKFYFIKLFAKNEEQAIAKALGIRNNYIEDIWDEESLWEKL